MLIIANPIANLWPVKETTIPRVGQLHLVGLSVPLVFRVACELFVGDVHNHILGTWRIKPQSWTYYTV